MAIHTKRLDSHPRSLRKYESTGKMRLKRRLEPLSILTQGYVPGCPGKCRDK